jgi:hypothetical protein
MRTVEAILEQVYGGKREAAGALKAKINAPWNWRKWGHFPLKVAVQISRDAEEKGIELPLEEIPVIGNKPGDA